MNTTTIVAAEFTAGSKRRAPSLAITRINPALGERVTLETLAVAGRAEARRVAAERGARCWNF